MDSNGPQQRISMNRYVIFFAIVLLGSASDLITKQMVFSWRGLPNEQPAWWLVEDHLGIETAVNIGAVFGIGAGKGTLFAGLSVVAGTGVLVWLFYFGAAQSLWMCCSLAMVTGGIIGNLYDRVGLWWKEGMPEEWKSGVRDWILMQAGDAYKWPNYNIADSLLVVRAAMLVWQSFFPGKDASTTVDEAEAPQATNVH